MPSRSMPSSSVGDGGARDHGNAAAKYSKRMSRAEAVELQKQVRLGFRVWDLGFVV